MSTIADDTKQATRAARRPSPTLVEPRVAGAAVATSPLVVPHPVASPRSREIGLVVQAILFCAASLSLVAVIQQARSAEDSPGTGVSDPPPAVFVNAD